MSIALCKSKLLDVPLASSFKFKNQETVCSYQFGPEAAQASTSVFLIKSENLQSLHLLNDVISSFQAHGQIWIILVKFIFLIAIGSISIFTQNQEHWLTVIPETNVISIP
jgi:hypothetical protein